MSENQASVAVDRWTGGDTIWMQIQQFEAIVKNEVKTLKQLLNFYASLNYVTNQTFTEIITK